MKAKQITALLSIATLLAIVPPMSVLAESGPELPLASKEFALNGAGATFPFPLIDLWRVEYNNLYDNVNLNYQSIGSGGGIKQHIEKTVVGLILFGDIQECYMRLQHHQ